MCIAKCLHLMFHRMRLKVLPAAAYRIPSLVTFERWKGCVPYAAIDAGKALLASDTVLVT